MMSNSRKPLGFTGANWDMFFFAFLADLTRSELGNQQKLLEPFGFELRRPEQQLQGSLAVGFWGGNVT